MPDGAMFCTQCGNRFDQPVSEPVTEAVAADADAPATPPPAAPTESLEPDPTQPVSPQADPTQVWSTPPVAPTAAGTPDATPTPPTLPPPTEPPMAPVMVPPGPAPTAPPGPPVAPPTAAAWGTPPQSQPPMASPPMTPAPAASPTQEQTRVPGGGKFGAIVGLLGGAALIVGAFLPWLTSKPVGGLEQTISGWSLSDDAKIVLAIGAVAVVLAVVVLGGYLRGLVRGLFLIGGIAAIAIAGYDTYDILNRLPDRVAGLFPEGAKFAAPGLGLILVFAGGALLVIGALVMRPKRSAGPTPPATQPAAQAFPQTPPQGAPSMPRQPFGGS